LKTLKLVSLYLALILNTVGLHAAINLCSAYEIKCPYPVPEEGEDRRLHLSMLEFFDMSDRIWNAQRTQSTLKELKPRPAHLGQWETVLYTSKNTKNSIPGHLVDDSDHSFVNLFLEAPRHQTPLLAFKSFDQRNWFQFYPAGNDFYYISVSGKDAKGNYKPDIGLLYVDPKMPETIKIGLVHDYGWVHPTLPDGATDSRKLETPGYDFYLHDNSLDRSAYFFRVFPAKDKSGEAFYLQHASGRWLGSPKGVSPSRYPGGEEIITYGWLQLVHDFTPKEFNLFSFRLCDHLGKNIRTCVKF